MRGSGTVMLMLLSTTGCQAGQEDGPQRALPVLAAAFGRGVGAEAEGSRFGQRGSDSGASEAGRERDRLLQDSWCA